MRHGWGRSAPYLVGVDQVLFRLITLKAVLNGRYSQLSCEAVGSSMSIINGVSLSYRMNTVSIFL